MKKTRCRNGRIQSPDGGPVEAEQVKAALRLTEREVKNGMGWPREERLSTVGS